MTQLERPGFWLNFTDITDNGIKQLTGLTNLKALDLTATDVGDNGLTSVAMLTNLRELYLNHTRFTNKGLVTLKPSAPETGAHRAVPHQRQQSRHGCVGPDQESAGD